MSTIEVHAKDSLENLFTIINRWNKEKVQSVVISLEDLTLMKNHIEDLELEVYGSQEVENVSDKVTDNI